MDNQGVFNNFLGHIIIGADNNPDVAAITELTENLGDSFDSLSTLNDSDIDEFIKSNKERNRTAAHPNIFHNKIFQFLKSVLFEMKDRLQCGAIPDQATLDGIGPAYLTLLRANRNNALCALKNRRSNDVPSPSVVTLTNSNWREFRTSVTHSLSRIYGLHNIPLTYVIQQDHGLYDDAFDSRLERLVACTLHVGEE